jgi:hypothetical protein
MKVKFLAIVGLAAAFSSVGCKSAANTNTAVLNTNTNTMTTTTTMATVTPMMAASDPAAKAAVEAALKNKGITGVTVEATADAVTLRGTVADKTKMTEAMVAATDAGKRRVVNQLTSTK